jgi:hypothetical protein
MKNRIVKWLLAALLAASFIKPAQANPWWRPAKAPVKTVQLALPATNGVLVSVTVPSKTAPPKRSAGRGPSLGSDDRRARDSAANQREDERIAADLERHF